MKSTWVAVAVVGLLLSACDAIDLPSRQPPATRLVAFPVQPEMNSYPTGLVEGFLIIENGCIRLKATSGENYLMYWPNGYSYVDYTSESEQSANAIRVLDSDGATIATVDVVTSEQVKIGGGEIKQDVSNGVCGGISWLASGVKPPP